MLHLITQGMKAIHQFFLKIAILSNAVGSLVILGLVLVVNYDVFARELFHHPFLGAVEVVQFSMVLIVFLQLPDVIRVNKLTRSDGLITVIKDRFPLVATVLQACIDAVAAGLMILIAVTTWPEFLDAYITDDYFGIPGIFMAPWWPVKLVIFLSAVLCAILFVFKIFLPNKLHENTTYHDVDNLKPQQKLRENDQ
jgi:TRAP-type C4-dicarboxylate transport system permease small subunit